MNRKYLFISFVLFILFSSTVVKAQSGTSAEASGGSIYSSIGVGFPLDNTSAGLLSQGILGITNVNRETSGLANPALWAESFYTQAGTGIQLTRSDVENATTSGTNINLQTGYLHLLFPVKPGKVGLSFGLYPVTRANFRALNTSSFNNTETNSIEYTNEIQSVGGINKFEIGFAFKLGDNITLGYAPSVAFLSLLNTEFLDFNTLGFEPQSQEIDYSGAGFAQRFGITASLDGLFSENDKVSLGGTLNLPFTIEATEKFTAIKNVEGFDQRVDLNQNTNRTGDISMPMEMALGLGYSPGDLTNFAIEAQWQSWGDFENELNVESEQMMTDRVRFGFGGQYHPYRRNIDTFFSGFKYSAGLSYDSGHLNIMGEDINTLWINTGIGIPSKIASFIDLSLQYGMRGTTSNNLFEERIWSFGFSINLTERMFVRPKLR